MRMKFDFFFSLFLSKRNGYVNAYKSKLVENPNLKIREIYAILSKELKIAKATYYYYYSYSVSTT